MEKCFKGYMETKNPRITKTSRRLLDRMRGSEQAQQALSDRLEMLGKLVEAQNSALEKLTEKLATERDSERTSERRIDAISALGKVLESLASVQASSQKHTAQVLDALLEKAGRQVSRSFFQEIGRKGGMAKRGYRKEGENVSRETSAVVRPEFTYACEECEALLDGRQPAHTDDMLRHATEEHLRKLRESRLIEVA